MAFHASKSGCALVMIAILAFAVASCGRKPSLGDLKRPPSQTETAEVKAPSSPPTIDGEADGLEPVEAAKPKRRLFLDRLL